MTTYEHAMLGVTGAMALGLSRRFGWKIVAMAGVVAITPDWDGLTLLGGVELFDRAHRAWGHNLLVGCLIGCLCALADYRFDLVGRARRLLFRLFSQGDEPAPLRANEDRTVVGYTAWLLVGMLAALSHLPADMIVSGSAELTDWHLQLLWPFSRQGFVYPLIPWGDIGVTLVFVGGMFAMLRWPTRLQTIANVTLLLVITYIVTRVVLHTATLYAASVVVTEDSKPNVPIIVLHGAGILPSARALLLTKTYLPKTNVEQFSVERGE